MPRPLGYDRPKPKIPRSGPKWNKRRCSALADRLHHQTGQRFLVYSTRQGYHTCAARHYPRIRFTLRHTRIVYTSQEPR